MLLLLDTHSLLWWLWDFPDLGFAAREAIDDRGNQAFISAVSIYENGYKINAGRLEAPENLEATLAGLGFTGMPVTTAHAERASQLPMHHRNPFDRILIAQAMSEGMALVTADSEITKYDVSVLPAQD